jgi:LCP family protein required for cell wall assembly
MSFSVRRIRTDPPRRRFPWKRTLLTALTFARPLLGWYEAWKHRQEEEHRTTVLKRFLLVLVAVFCALLLLAGTAKALLGIRSLGLKTLVAVTGGELPVDERGHTNLLLLGQGDASHDGKDLTDTIMVVSFDPKETGSVVALSLPRDLYFLSTEKMGKGRLNSFYRDYKGYLRNKGMSTPDASQEAMRELAAEIGLSLGIAMHGSVKVDFQGFVDTVDVLGGITIEVPQDILDTEYPDENYGFETFSLPKGPQHLNGATALKYARSRHTSSDFDRSARQQQILLALAEKAKAEKIHRDVGAITNLLRILAEHVETTLTVREIIALAGAADQLDRTRVVTMQLSDRNGLYGSLAEPGGFLYTPPRDLFGGASVLLPVSIPQYPVTWKQIHTLGRLLFGRRYTHSSHPAISIVNAGARSGSARVLGAELVRYGFAVEHIANAETLPEQPSSWIAENTESAPTAEFFATLLKIPVQEGSGITPSEQRTVTIVLGKDYTYQPLQDLLPAQ